MFEKLNEIHFSLLLRWLESPHVKRWWDSDITWNEKLIKEKYETYVEGYKVLKLKSGEVIQKPINGYIIMYEDTPIGYIQYYDKDDFPSHHGYESLDIPKPCAGLDWYIGEVDFIGKGIGSEVLKLFIKDVIPQEFSHIFVDPEIDNIAAIRAYEKAGFQKIAEKVDEGVIWMTVTIS